MEINKTALLSTVAVIENVQNVEGLAGLQPSATNRCKGVWLLQQKKISISLPPFWYFVNFAPPLITVPIRQWSNMQYALLFSSLLEGPGPECRR